MTYQYLLPTHPFTMCALSFRVFPDGAVEATLSSDAPKVLGSPPEFGVCFKMDAAFNHVSFLGLGPEETYCDRKQGAKLGVYENLVLENETSVIRSDGSILTSFRLREKSDVELLKEQIETMKEQQEVQDGAIADLGEAVSGLAEGSAV